MSEPLMKPSPSKRKPPPRKGSVLKPIFVILFVLIFGYLFWEHYQETGEPPWKDPERTLSFAKRKLWLAQDRIEESRVLLEEQLAVSKEVIGEQSEAIGNWIEGQEVLEWFKGEKIKPGETWDEMRQVASTYLPFSGGEGKPRRKVTPSERVDADAAERLAAEEASRQAAYEARRTARHEAAAAERRRQLEARNPRPPEPSPAPEPVESVPAPRETQAVPTEPLPPVIAESPPPPVVAESPPPPVIAEPPPVIAESPPPSLPEKQWGKFTFQIPSKGWRKRDRNDLVGPMHIKTNKNARIYLTPFRSFTFATIYNAAADRFLRKIHIRNVKAGPLVNARHAEGPARRFRLDYADDFARRTRLYMLIQHKQMILAVELYATREQLSQVEPAFLKLVRSVRFDF